MPSVLHHGRSAFAILSKHPDRLALFIQQEHEEALDDQVVSLTDETTSIVFVALDNEEWTDLLTSTKASDKGIAFLVSYDRAILAKFDTIPEITESIFEIAKAFRTKVRRLVVDRAAALAPEQVVDENEEEADPAQSAKLFSADDWLAEKTTTSSDPFPGKNKPSAKPLSSETKSDEKKKPKETTKKPLESQPFPSATETLPRLRATAAKHRLAITYPDRTRKTFSDIEPTTSLMVFTRDFVLPSDYPRRAELLAKGSYVDPLTKQSFLLEKDGNKSLIDLSIESGSNLILQTLSAPSASVVVRENRNVLAIRENVTAFTYAIWAWIWAFLMFFKRLFTGRA